MLINNIRKSPTCPIRNTIHAPTRGATPYGLLTANVRLFQSTLLQEERHEKIAEFLADVLFQSTLLQEERRPRTYSV